MSFGDILYSIILASSALFVTWTVTTHKYCIEGILIDNFQLFLILNVTSFIVRCAVCLLVYNYNCDKILKPCVNLLSVYPLGY